MMTTPVEPHSKDYDRKVEMELHAPTMAELCSYKPWKFVAAAFYFKYRHMLLSPFSPGSGKFEWFRKNKQALRIIDKEDDLKYFIMVNLGYKHYKRRICIFCCGDGAHSFKGEEWAYHIRCHEKVVKWSCLNGYCEEGDSLIYNFIRMLKLSDKQKPLMYEFYRVREMCVLFDWTTSKKYKQKRIQLVGDLQSWDYQSSMLHWEFVVGGVLKPVGKTTAIIEEEKNAISKMDQQRQDEEEMQIFKSMYPAWGYDEQYYANKTTKDKTPKAAEDSIDEEELEIANSMYPLWGRWDKTAYYFHRL